MEYGAIRLRYYFSDFIPGMIPPAIPLVQCPVFKIPRPVKRFAILPFVVLLYGCAGDGPRSFPSWAYQLQGAEPSQIAALNFGLVVIDYSRDGTEGGAYSRKEIGRLKSSGKVVLAYLSIGEAEDYRFYWREEWSRDPPPWLGPENPEWPGNYVVRYWEDGWKGIVFRYLKRIVSRGFSGVYLDKLDSYEYFGDSLGYGEAARRMASLVMEVADSCRAWAGECVIIPQNGEGILKYVPGVLEYVDGWAVEDVLYGDGGPERLATIRRVRDAGKIVLSVEYVYDGDVSKVEDYYRTAREEGLLPYAADTSRRLDRLVVIPGIQGE